MRFMRDALVATSLLVLANGCADVHVDYTSKVDCEADPQAYETTGTEELAAVFNHKFRTVIELSDGRSSVRVRLNAVGHVAIGNEYAKPEDAGRSIATLKTAEVVVGIPAEKQPLSDEPVYEHGERGITLVCESSDLAPPHA